MHAERLLRSLGFAAALVVLAFVAAGAYRTASSIEANTAAIEHRHLVLEHLQKVQAALGAAESGRRGFLLSGDRTMLAGYEAALVELPRSLGELRQLLTDNPRQQARLAELEAAVTQRVDLLRRSVTLALRAPGVGEEQRAATAASVARGIETRQILSEMDAEERLLLAQREEKAAADGQQARRNVLVGSSVGAVLLVVTFGFLSWENRERRRAADEALRTSRILRAVFEGTPDAVFVTDRECRYLMINRAGAALFGRTPEDVIGRGVAEILPPEAGRAQEARDREIMESGQIGNTEERLPLGGAERVFLMTKGPLRDGGGRVMGLVGIARDITERQHLEETLSRSNAELTATVRDLERKTHEITLLAEMAGLVQAPLKTKEAHRVLAHFGERLLPDLAGALCLTNLSGDQIEPMASWGKAAPCRAAFPPNDCWALRTGKPYRRDSDQAVLACGHFHPEPAPPASLCIPMQAQGETLGVLVLHAPVEAETPLAGPARLPEPQYQLALALAEQMSLAVANLALRETLRHQAVRDPLTGVFNRRYMEESLERELRRATRHKSEVGVIMVDVDGFKAFNDTHGHEAGDQTLRAVAQLLKREVRGEDIVCRYGGEEFTVILPDASLENTRKRAQTLCEKVRALELTHRGQPLGSVTASMGVSAFPGHGDLPAVLLRRADAALYQAKHAGRNCVVVASFASVAPVTRIENVADPRLLRKSRGEPPG